MSNTNNTNCQHCGQNPAQLVIRFQQEDQGWEVHLCSECAARIRSFTEAAMREYHRKMVHAMAGGSGAPAFGGVSATQELVPTQDAVPDEETLARLQVRRRLAQLQARLEDAVAGEQYETAARLRDQIISMEKEAQIL